MAIKQELRTSTPTTPRRRQPAHLTFAQMVEELIDLSSGLVIALLPMLVLAAPGLVLFVALPAIILLALLAPLAVIAVPPYLLTRWLRQRRKRSAIGVADSFRRSLRTSERAHTPHLGSC
jgi:hypothetical protein